MFSGADDEHGDLESRLEGTISEFTLANGMHFVVKQRHNAPVVACHTYANVGAFDDEDGNTGALRRNQCDSPARSQQPAPMPNQRFWPTMYMTELVLFTYEDGKTLRNCQRVQAV